MSATFMAAWMGRFPHPDDAERYEQLYPGFMDRHFQLYEREQEIVAKQAQHRQQQEQRRLEADIQSEMLGLKFAFVLAVLLIIAAVVLGILGHDTVAIACIGTGLGIGVVAFIAGRRGAAKERVEKIRTLDNLRRDDNQHNS